MLLRLASSAQIPVEGIYARSPEKAEALAAKFQCKAKSGTAKVRRDPTISMLDDGLQSPEIGGMMISP